MNKLLIVLAISVIAPECCACGGCDFGRTWHSAGGGDSLGVDEVFSLN
jgi:hypothetical protein